MKTKKDETIQFRLFYFVVESLVVFVIQSAFKF